MFGFILIFVLLMVFAMCLPYCWQGRRWGILSSAVSVALVGAAMTLVLVAPI